MRSICIYHGPSPGGRPEYKANVIELDNEMVKHSLTLVYDGSNVGLMGVVADAVLYGGSPIIDIIPKSLVRKEVGHKELTELYTADSMHQRKQMMVDRTGAFIVMPGGVGTYEELFETFTWLQPGYHNKSIGLLNMTGFYGRLSVFIGRAVQESFLRRHHADLLHVNNDLAALTDTLTCAPRETVDKWSERRKRT